MDNNTKKYYFMILVASIVVSAVIGGLAGFLAAESISRSRPFLDKLERALKTSEPTVIEQRLYDNQNESSIVEVVEQASPAVVSIIVTKDLPVRGSLPMIPDDLRSFLGPDLFGRFFDEQAQDEPETQRREIGGGTGFLVSSDGMIVTNRHVVDDESADYTVLLNSGERLPAQVLARDPFNDMAVLKVEGQDFSHLILGDSDELKVGQTVIAIGNALGEFRNTVSTGVISGLARSINALGQGYISERLSGLIQTDASINPGNSGGPLLNASGLVIGINVAVAQGAQNIGFAIPINQVKTAIESVKTDGRIIRPWLGVRYAMLNEALAEMQGIERTSGALIIGGNNERELAVLPDSPAAKAGLKAGDIIISINDEELSEEKPLAERIGRFKPGDKMEMSIERDGRLINLTVTLEEMPQ